ncbi:ExeM/NucH family extracellular endonuclease [Nostocoides sp. Soil756]|jgi:predicted extracellular nuclease|uniref:ExeM/NucH family extracellular endonuclease n=1 Tax=Nostocoides sp. Soil756 TaxID=1736399 RepID=UPI0009E71381|nr:ExeM/NucH family extracellular endonuclease [Tetrasphaera sp. Soil756]
MNRTPLRRLVGRVAVGALALAVPVALTPTPASAAPTDLLISEYVEGSSNNKALEIYNGTGSPVDLDAYTVQVFANGTSTANSTITLTGTVAPGDVYVLANGSANATIKAAADLLSGSANWNGNDAVTLRHDGAVIDSFGQLGTDPGAEWGTDVTSTKDHTLRRKATVCAGDATPGDAFDPAVQWDGYAVDTVDGLGAHTADCGPVVDLAPTVTAATPQDGATVAGSTSPTVTFSEPVALASDAVTLACTSGDVAVTVTGGPTEYTVDPATDLALGQSCTLTVHAAGVSDVDANDPPDTLAADYTTRFGVGDVCAASYTRIPAIQGSGETSPLAGRTVTTQGVVVADYEGRGSLRGYYLQDATGDGDPATSDGVFVFDGGADEVSRGDVVRVTGAVSEFQGQTQLVASTTDACGTGTVTPTEVRLPMASATDFEKYEGMLVTMPQTLSVTEHYQLGRFGQVTVSSGGRLQQPTNVVAPGREANALQAKNDLNRLIVDDTLNSQNPDPIIWGRGGQPLSASNTLRGGDTLTGATGVMTYTWGGNSASPNSYRLRPVDQTGAGITFTAANPRPTTPEDVGGDVQVVGMNLLNYFNTLDTTGDNCTGGVTGPPMDCRGANTATELERQTAKTVAAILALDADVYGVNEIENDGYGPSSAIATLVDRLNAAAGPGTFAYLDVDARTGQVDALGSDAIKVGSIYRPAAVTPVGRTAVLNSVEFVNGGDPAPRARPSLAQAWKVNATGGVFVTDVNHLKSKGSGCSVPDAGDGQGNCNVVRTNSVKALLAWLASDPTGTGDDDVLLVGDYNSYAKEDPIRTLEAGGFTNLVAKYQGKDAYSYVFDGQWGYLDHALGSDSLLDQVTGVADYHINADEPSVLDYNTDFKSADLQAMLYAPDQYRVSDHDPVKIGLAPNSPPTASAAFSPVLVGCGRAATLTVDIADRDAADTHTVAITWGDGTTGTVQAAAGRTRVTATHTYATAGRYTASVVVTDSHGQAAAPASAVVSVAYATTGFEGPLSKEGRTSKKGSTLPVKIAFADCDGSVPTDLAPVVTVSTGGTTVLTGAAALVDGTWQYNLRTGDLPGTGTFTVTVTVPETGQTQTASFVLR